eukprot:COSAG03_NODE_3790_length_1829_cov_6.047977_2_plen_180_part_00
MPGAAESSQSVFASAALGRSCTDRRSQSERETHARARARTHARTRGREEGRERRACSRWQAVDCSRWDGQDACILALSVSLSTSARVMRHKATHTDTPQRALLLRASDESLSDPAVRGYARLSRPAVASSAQVEEAVTDGWLVAASVDSAGAQAPCRQLCTVERSGSARGVLRSRTLPP